MWSRTDNAHVAEKHVPELWDFIEAEPAQPFSQAINTRIAVTGLPRKILVIGLHSAKFINLKLPVLHTGASLHVKEWPRRLGTLDEEDD